MFLQRTQKLVKLEGAQKALQKAKPQNQEEVSKFNPSIYFIKQSLICICISIAGKGQKYSRRRLQRHFRKM
jgi:hypothetical protein